MSAPLKSSIADNLSVSIAMPGMCMIAVSVPHGDDVRVVGSAATTVTPVSLSCCRRHSRFRVSSAARTDTWKTTVT